MHRDRTAEQILMDDIKMYYDDCYTHGNERVAERDSRLLMRAERLIDKFELYLKTLEKKDEKNTAKRKM